MATYKISFRTFAWTNITVEADTFEDAVEAAWQADFPSICAQCSGWGREASLELGDEWEPDETFYTVDGRDVTVPRQATS